MAPTSDADYPPSPMQASQPTAVVDGDVVQVFQDGSLAGTGRFADSGIVDYRGRLLGDTEAAHRAALIALAERVLDQAREELAAMQVAAYDDAGVDMSLIRWMLSLTPFDRLRTLDAHRQFVSLGRASLRNKGFFVPEEVK